ncbi:hypothetical protein LCGC14_2932470, partial [marine sediment metagenome]
MLKRICLIALTLLFVAGQALAAEQFYLTWDPNTEADLSHYVAYWCDPGLD